MTYWKIYKYEQELKKIMMIKAKEKFWRGYT